jgi:hypothetical protein
MILPIIILNIFNLIQFIPILYNVLSTKLNKNKNIFK